MSYTFINIWQDGQPYRAYEIPDRTLIGEWWAPPMLILPTDKKTRLDPRPKEWPDVIRYLARCQADPRFTLRESLTEWGQGWELETVRP